MFSVVIPVYNVEQYIEETLNSVIGQSIGFKENIQIILVNDGSPDNSKDICLKYKEQYPENIVYIEKENGGVSSARNAGIKYIKGKYVNFLDSDDKWELNAFEKVYKFFEENKDEIDVVACRLKYFEASSGYNHPLNAKFSRDRIVFTKFEYSCIQMHMASCFIKSNCIEYEFNAELKYGEDALFINQIILQKQQYGIMRSVDYLYRKRADENSALDTCQQRVEFYNKTLTNFHDCIINFSKDKFGTVPYYIQYLVMYDCQWRVKRVIPDGVLTDENAEIYINHVKSVLKNIEDFIIMEQKNIWPEHKVYAMNLKRDYDICQKLSQRKNDLYYENLKIFSIKNPSLLRVEEVKVKNNSVHLEGFINTFIPVEHYEIYFEDDYKNKYPLKDTIDYAKKVKVCLEGDYYPERYFKIDIPIDNSNECGIKAVFVYKNGFPINIEMGFTNNCNMNRNCKNSYYRTKERIVLYKDCRLIFKKYSSKELRGQEKKYRKELWSKSKKSALYRMIYFMLSHFIKKEIWIISDRPNKAGDNGEHLFKYLQTVNNKNIKTYFAIQKDSEDYNRMKSVGKVLVYDSLKYKMFMLLSKNVISSQASDYIVNPLSYYKKFMVDLYNFNFTFLQHGITKDDISDWLNRASKDIKIFVTAGKPEYQSILDGDYYYGEDRVKLTGFPRYDNLLRMNSAPKKKVLLIPTWRQSLKQCVDPKTDTSVYYDGFKESDYFKFYNSLINDERLIKAMKENGYEGLFCMHPLFTAQSVDFKENDVFKVNKGYVDYQKEFAEGSLLITDYSSVFFDFAYLRKPVVYSQFDKETFFAGHSYSQGYFSYEDDGFGPVCYDVDSVVNAVIKEIQNGCQNDKKYLDRIEKFYPYFDENNCQRVYDAILKIPD